MKEPHGFGERGSPGELEHIASSPVSKGSDEFISDIRSDGQPDTKTRRLNDSKSQGISEHLKNSSPNQSIQSEADSSTDHLTETSKSQQRSRKENNKESPPQESPKENARKKSKASQTSPSISSPTIHNLHQQFINEGDWRKRKRIQHCIKDETMKDMFITLTREGHTDMASKVLDYG